MTALKAKAQRLLPGSVEQLEKLTRAYHVDDQSEAVIEDEPRFDPYAAAQDAVRIAAANILGRTPTPSKNLSWEDSVIAEMRRQRER